MNFNYSMNSIVNCFLIAVLLTTDFALQVIRAIDLVGGFMLSGVPDFPDMDALGWVVTWFPELC